VSELLVLDTFEDWNAWYADNKVEVKNQNWYPNQGVIIDGGNFTQSGIILDGVIHKTKHYAPSSIAPKNAEQAIALELLRQCKNIPLTILSGVAGSGKTLIAVAHALERLHSNKDNIKKLFIAKSLTPVGKDIGYLKGDMNQKVLPWLGPFKDAMNVCGYDDTYIELMQEHGKLEITPITFIQGRSIADAILIIDEVQNLDLNIIKQIITRASEGTQVILLGDQTQKFSLHRDASLSVLLEKGRASPLVGTIHLTKTQRSPIAGWAIENL
jgi:PhoH-like ATPase